jgi:hypothetical protein
MQILHLKKPQDLRKDHKNVKKELISKVKPKIKPLFNIPLTVKKLTQNKLL